MKLNVLLFVYVCSASILFAQKRTVFQDTLAFRQYLSDNIGTAMNAQALVKIYQRLSMPYRKGEVKVSSEIEPPAPVYKAYEYNGSPDGKASFFLYGGKNLGDWTTSSGTYWHLDNAKFPDSLRNSLKEDFYRYHAKKDMKVEKARLVRNLEQFDSLSGNKPIFFATIHSRYGGNIRKYVDDLYGKSIMGSKSRLFRFCRWPTARKLQADLSVQFAIGLALYELWIKQVRDGEIPYDAADGGAPN